jgi:transcription elongation factor GreA
MPSNEKQDMNLGDCAAQYLEKLSVKEKDTNQVEVYKFARWCGWEKPFSRLAGPAVASYAEQLSVSDIDYAHRLEMVRAFLAYAKKAGWSQTNLGIHVKTKKGKNAPVAPRPRNVQEPVALTKQKYDELKVELDDLKAKSLKLMRDIQTAAADKDFRENAPLHAAREERGHVEGRIKELDEMFKAATIIDEKKEPTLKSGVGDTIILTDLASGQELRYRIVDPREVNASKGKISIASPLGKALLGKQGGQEIEIVAPVGRLRYKIIRIER